MADAAKKLPVESDDMKAQIFAAFDRIASVPERATLIDEMSDDEWLSDEPDAWAIEAGSDRFEGEIDVLDKRAPDAA